MRRLSYLAALALIVGLACGTAHAGPLAVDFTAPGLDFTNGAWSLGWEFTVNSPITVTSLGFYDDLKNGLTEAHDVGIYDLGGTLLTSTTVTNGDPLNSWWREHNVAPLALTPGETYRIAAETGSENYTWDPVGFTVDPRITYNGSEFVLSPTLAFPVDSDGFTGYFGPNFNSGTSTPEPTTLAFLALGGLALARRRRRRGNAV